MYFFFVLSLSDITFFHQFSSRSYKGRSSLSVMDYPLPSLIFSPSESAFLVMLSFYTCTIAPVVFFAGALKYHVFGGN